MDFKTSACHPTDLKILIKGIFKKRSVVVSDAVAVHLLFK